jgi:hypothetical protein
LIRAELTVAEMALECKTDGAENPIACTPSKAVLKQPQMFSGLQVGFS